MRLMIVLLTACIVAACGNQSLDTGVSPTSTLGNGSLAATASIGILRIHVPTRRRSGSLPTTAPTTATSRESGRLFSTWTHTRCRSATRGTASRAGAGPRASRPVGWLKDGVERRVGVTDYGRTAIASISTL
jgi:hypothetical protein